MLLQTKIKIKSQTNNEYLDGQFDAAIGLPPKNYDGDYWRGYLAKVNESGVTPF